MQSPSWCCLSILAVVFPWVFFYEIFHSLAAVDTQPQIAVSREWRCVADWRTPELHKCAFEPVCHSDFSNKYAVRHCIPFVSLPLISFKLFSFNLLNFRLFHFLSLSFSLFRVVSAGYSPNSSRGPQPQASLFVGFVVDTVVVGQVFSGVLRVFSISIIPPVLRTHSSPTPHYLTADSFISNS